jgi:ABC-2 type transport system permease protein
MNKATTQIKWNNFFANIKVRILRVLNQVKKEFRMLWTDKFNLFIALIVPPLIVALLGILGNLSSDVAVSPVNCVLVSYDSDTFINENNYTESKLDDFQLPYINAVNDSDLLNLIRFYNASREVYAMEMARQLLIQKQIEVIITIPVDFSELLEWGYPGLIDCIVDSSDPTKIQTSLNAVFDSIKIFINDNNLTPEFKLTGFEEFSIPKNYNVNFNNSIVMALSFMVIGVGMVLTILVIVQEKPIARLLLTPVKRSEILSAKYITYTIILVIQNISLVATALSFNLYIAGSVLDLFLALFILGFSGLSLGIFISSSSKTKTEANQLFFAVFLVLVLLSGTFIPISAMPIYLQAIAYILPLSHGDPLIRGIITKGKSIFGFDFYILLIVSIVLIILSFILFERRKYEV